jgi:hypothetical protein
MKCGLPLRVNRYNGGEKLMTTIKQDAEFIGVIFCVIGLYYLLFAHDLQTGFLMFGFGIAFMAYGSPSRMKRIFDLFFSMFKKLLSLGRAS